MRIDGQKVKEERAARGWSQQHLADAADLSLRTVQRVENLGAASPETMLALQSALESPLQPDDSNSEEEPITPLIQSPFALAALLFGTSFLGALLGAGLTLWLAG